MVSISWKHLIEPSSRYVEPVHRYAICLPTLSLGPVLSCSYEGYRKQMLRNEYRQLVELGTILQGSAHLAGLCYLCWKGLAAVMHEDGYIHQCHESEEYDNPHDDNLAPKS